MAEKEPEPQEMYKSHLKDATDNILGVKKEHDKAAVSVYQTIADDFKNVDPKDEKKVYDLLKKAAIEYKKQVKIINGEPNDEFELGEVIQTLQQRGLDPAEVIKRFQTGEGRGVIEKLMEHYKAKHLQGKHNVWYHKNIGLDFDKKHKLAKGYKIHHNATEDEGSISESLEQKLYQQAHEQATQ